MQLTIFKDKDLNDVAIEKVAQFLFVNLEHFGDPLDEIIECLLYIKNNFNGGHVIVAMENEEIVGAVVTNKTGMKKYIPENILVYIAVDSKVRGRGIGKLLIDKVKEVVKGDIALHVEPDNPALRLYRREGFENKYLEMRLSN